MECGFSVSKSGVSNDEVRSHFRQIRVKKKNNKPFSSWVYRFFKTIPFT